MNAMFQQSSEAAISSFTKKAKYAKKRKAESEMKNIDD